MSRTHRIYNKPTYFRRYKSEDGYWWIWYPRYHPWYQWSVVRNHRADEGVTPRWLTKRRRHWYRYQMRDEIRNL